MQIGDERAGEGRVISGVEMMHVTRHQPLLAAAQPKAHRLAADIGHKPRFIGSHPAPSLFEAACRRRLSRKRSLPRGRYQQNPFLLGKIVSDRSQISRAMCWDKVFTSG